MLSVYPVAKAAFAAEFSEFSLSALLSLAAARRVAGTFGKSTNRGARDSRRFAVLRSRIKNLVAFPILIEAASLRSSTKREGRTIRGMVREAALTSSDLLTKQSRHPSRGLRRTPPNLISVTTRDAESKSNLAEKPPVVFPLSKGSRGSWAVTNLYLDYAAPTAPVRANLQPRVAAK